LSTYETAIEHVKHEGGAFVLQKNTKGIIKGVLELRSRGICRTGLSQKTGSETITETFEL
jgi:hypothetical protein